MEDSFGFGLAESQGDSEEEEDEGSDKNRLGEQKKQSEESDAEGEGSTPPVRRAATKGNKTPELPGNRAVGRLKIQWPPPSPK
jgi:hypothetical protein